MLFELWSAIGPARRVICEPFCWAALHTGGGYSPSQTGQPAYMGKDSNAGGSAGRGTVLLVSFLIKSIAVAAVAGGALYREHPQVFRVLGPSSARLSRSADTGSRGHPDEAAAISTYLGSWASYGPAGVTTGPLTSHTAWEVACTPPSPRLGCTPSTHLPASQRKGSLRARGLVSALLYLRVPFHS